jgi:hypothetical protein
MAGCRTQIVNGIPGKSIWISGISLTPKDRKLLGVGQHDSFVEDGFWICTPSQKTLGRARLSKVAERLYKPMHNRGRAALRGPREAFQHVRASAPVVDCSLMCSFHNLFQPSAKISRGAAKECGPQRKLWERRAG